MALFFANPRRDMEIHFAGNPIADANRFLEIFLRPMLVQCGWDSVAQPSIITISTLSIPEHSLVFVKYQQEGQKIYEFVKPGHDPQNGGIPVRMENNDYDTLANLGGKISATFGWLFEVFTDVHSQAAIKFIMLPDPGSDVTFNGISFSASPFGSIYRIDGAVQTGQSTPEAFSYAGGFQLFNQAGFSVKFVTGNQDDYLDVTVAGCTHNFSAIRPQKTTGWRILCNPYQYVLYSPHASDAGSLMILSSMRPTNSSSSFNYAMGGTNAVQKSGGTRQTLDDICGLYYTVNGYTGFVNNDANKTPALQAPGYAKEKSVNKVFNRIGNRNILKLDGSAMVSETLMAACPTLNGTYQSMGYLWNSALLGAYDTIDNNVSFMDDTLDLIGGTVILSDDGHNGRYKGSFVVQIGSSD